MEVVARDGEGRSLLAVLGEHVVGEARGVGAVVPGSQGELDDMLAEEKVKWKQKSLLAVVGEHEARGVVAVVPGSQWEVDDKMEEEVLKMREMFSNQLPVPHERRHFLLFLLPKSTFMTQLMKNKKRGVD